jgi:hypothetical protein
MVLRDLCHQGLRDRDGLLVFLILPVAGCHYSEMVGGMEQVDGWGVRVQVYSTCKSRDKGL